MKVLVLATEPVDPDTLRSALDGGGEDALRDAQVRVVAPAVNDSKLAFWVSDPDEAIAEADRTQRETVEGLSREGVEASGDTGESDPLQAVQDALVEFPAERIVVVARREGQRAYREDELVESVGERTGLPVTRVVVGR